MSKIIKAILLLGASLLPIAGMATPLAYIEGVHYRPTTERIATNDEKVVEVLELFSFSCPHCFHLEPLIEIWRNALPENVVFNQVPAIFRDSWLQYARVFYAAEVTGDSEKLHSAIFNAIHLENRRLETEDQLLDFIAEQGIDRDMFAKKMDSFSVKGKVNKALIISKTSGITGVPSMIVNGKYIVDAPMAGGTEEMLDVVDYLIKQELNKLK